MFSLSDKKDDWGGAVYEDLRFQWKKTISKLSKVTKFSFKVLVAVFASCCHIYVSTLFVLSLGYRFGNIATNVLGIAEGGDFSNELQ